MEISTCTLFMAGCQFESWTPASPEAVMIGCAKAECRTAEPERLCVQYAEMMYVSAYCCGAFDLVGSYKQLEQ